MTERFVVLISDPLPGEARDILTATHRIEVLEQQQDLESVLPRVHGWIVRSATKVTAALLEHAPQLKGICRAGAGVDNIDLPAATRHGVVVMNTPGSNARAAAEHTVALLLSLVRNIPFAHAALMQGGWGRKDFVGVEVMGKRIGIVGMGKVGRHVSTMARGLGMEVMAVDPFLSPEAAADLGIQLCALDELLPAADFITLHTPLTDETRGLIGKQALARCKRGVRIVNCSRGGVVDEAALLAGIEAGQVAGAALDVFAQEPLPADSPLRTHPRVIVTPHLGASTLEAQEQVATASAEQLRDLLLDGTVTHAVNAASLAGHDRVRYSPLAHLALRLGSLQAQLLAGQPQSLTVELEAPESSAVERLLVDHAVAGFLQISSENPVNAVNARMLARERGLEVNARALAQPCDWTRWLAVTVSGPHGALRVEGAVVGKHALRLVHYAGYTLDGALDGPLLITTSHDRPGMIGRIASLLGELGTNIANLSVGRAQAGGSALSVFNLDSIPDANAMARIAALDGVTSAVSVRALP